MASRVLRATALGRLRLASVEDAHLVMELISEPMAGTFRINTTRDVIYMIENCVLSICQLDINDRLVGFLAARDYPPVPSVHPSAWEEYVWTKYKAVELNARNTLFIHLICWNNSYARDVVDSMLRSIFMHDPYVQHIGMVKSVNSYPLLIPGQSRSEASFRRVQAMERGIPGDRLPVLCVADRTEVSPRLRIRRAVEEDNDDIVPILEAHSKTLRELYGDFYVSELISRHPESDRVLLVCEHKEVAVGVMCLNTEINFESLEESFELSPFSGLRKLAPLYKRTKELDSIASFSAASMINAAADYSVFSKQYIYDSGSRNIKSRVTWLFDEEEFNGMRDEYSVVAPTRIDLHHLSAPAQLDALDILEDDEEELEFDIVNIDRDLLSVAKLLSYDDFDRSATNTTTDKLLEMEKRRKDDETPKAEKSKTFINTIEKQSEPTRYSGASNAFLLEIFAMHQDYDERYGFDMLEVAYELFPDRDYCLICLPSHHASFPLLEHFTLVTPFGSQMRFINETLYVAHVNSIRGNLSVRPGEPFDLPALVDVVEHAPRGQVMLDLFESSFTSYTLSCYVMLSQNQPVGMVVLGPLEDGTSIRTQYDLEAEPRRPGTDGTIIVGVLSPALEPHSRWFMRELLRLTQYSSLFWMCRLFAKGEANPSKNLMSLGGYMVPVHPRRLIQNISENKDLDKIYKDIAMPFALWILERPLSSLPKVYVNNSILVVGASRTGLAFIETLLLGPTSKYLTFSNVTLVSEHGLPTVSECLQAADICVPKNGRYTDRYLKSVPFYFYLDVMSAVMVGIDRKNKCIQLKGGGVKFYDQLILTCGQQFQHPEYLHESLELVRETQMGKPCERVMMDNPKYHPDKVPQPPEIPDNFMLINSLYEANICLRKLMCMISDAKDTDECLSCDNQVIVYGDNLEAYSCMSALLELGLSAELITFVESFPPEDPNKLRVNCFNNETVDKRVMENIKRMGIRAFRGYHLVSWRQEDTHVQALHLMTQLQAVCVPCFALFYYGTKAIDLNAFKAINECGLVYDGGLVVGPSFETNDPNVSAAGTCVKYSRRLYANKHAQKYYCSEDVGEALAHLFLQKLDPFVMANPDVESVNLVPRYSSSLLAGSCADNGNSSATVSLSPSRRWQPVMKFDSPIILCATLPGPLYYMSIRNPGIEIPMAVQMVLPDQGHTLITDKKENYFRLQLNVLHCIDSVTCLSKKPFSAEILSQLYGKHEAFFNKLLIRYQMHEIDDLFDFFTQPWMSAMYQQPFTNLIKNINDQDVGLVQEMIKSKFSIFEDDGRSRKSILRQVVPCSDQTSGPSPKEGRSLSLFRSIMDKFMSKSSILKPASRKYAPQSPKECGQNAMIRSEAAEFWKSVDGDRIVMAHLAGYLNRNSVVNPHYAVPQPENI